MVSGPSHTCLPLSLLRCKERGRVVDVVGDSQQVHRLREMGLCCGSEVCMVRPGAPCIIALEGRRLSLRLEAGTEVLVEPTSP